MSSQLADDLKAARALIDTHGYLDRGGIGVLQAASNVSEGKYRRKMAILRAVGKEQVISARDETTETILARFDRAIAQSEVE